MLHHSQENAKETVVLGWAPYAWTCTKSEACSYVICASTRSKPMNSDDCSGTPVERSRSENRTPRAVHKDTEPPGLRCGLSLRARRLTEFRFTNAGDRRFGVVLPGNPLIDRGA
jgi:hypothetical protein